MQHEGGCSRCEEYECVCGDPAVEAWILETKVIHCEHCGSSAEHVEIMALFAGIDNPICCDDSQWERTQ